MTDETKPVQQQLDELRQTCALQHAALTILIHVIDKKVPDLNLKRDFPTLYAETMMHYAPHVGPDIPESLERYLHSLILRD